MTNQSVPEKDEVPAAPQAPPEAAGQPAEAEPAAQGEPTPEPYRTPEALLAEKEQEVAVLKDRLLRLQAEFENYKKRQARERAEFLKFANEGLLRELLPVLDSLERAVVSAGDAAQPAALRTGMEMILRLFRSTLEKSGVTLIECQGAPFDPALMQAVQQVESPDGSEGAVAEVVQQGYLLEGRVLRPAMVKVFRAAGPAQAPPAPADA